MAPDNEDKKPTAYQVDDDSNLEQKDLERNFLFGKGEEKFADERDMEGEGTGGQRFGENNNTPSGDDKNNPSQNAGYTNAYFSRTEPSEEHPENSNFKDPNQSGQSNYTQANEDDKTGASEVDNVDNETDSGRQLQPDEGYQKGTADGKEINIPGPNELPDQQKVGE